MPHLDDQTRTRGAPRGSPECRVRTHRLLAVDDYSELEPDVAIVSDGLWGPPKTSAGTRPQLDSGGVLASLGRRAAQVSVEQLDLGVRLQRAGFDRAFQLGPAPTVVAADRDRNRGLRHRASYDPPP